MALHVSRLDPKSSVLRRRETLVVRMSSCVTERLLAISLVYSFRLTRSAGDQRYKVFRIERQITEA
jgi:hypothetical protein